MLVKDFIKIIHRLAPPDLAMEWDNSGLQVGSSEAEVTKIGLALDATMATVNEALDTGCDLLFTHHPLIFKSLKSIEFESPEGAIIRRAITGNLCIFSAHTNWDAANLGVAAALADLLELEYRRPLDEAVRDFYKLVVFVPKGYEEPLREALFEAGAGEIGDYSRCWFTAPGEGGFHVPAGGAPFIGELGEDARTKESRLELLLPRLPSLSRICQIIYENHPYEEPAFQFHPVKLYGREGIGLIGTWPHARDPLAECREKLGSHFRCCGPKAGRVNTVALVPGSGGSYIKKAKGEGAEVLICGDVSYHQALEAEQLGLTVLDLGHFETEWPGILRLKDIIAKECPSVACQVLTQRSPWHYEGARSGVSL